MKTRRSFLRGVAAGLTLTPVTGTTALGSTNLEEFPLNEKSYWNLVRAQFSFHEDKVPLNAANLCPSPRVVADRVNELTADIDRDCSSNNRAQFRKHTENSRDRVAKQLGVSSDEIALVRNTSEANNTINNGLSLQKGDEVVLWDQNHPTNNVAWDVRAARFGLTVKRVSTPIKPKSTTELFDAFAKALTNKTKVLTLTHVSNVTGIRLPVKDIIEEAHRKDIYVHVDGAQSWGALDIDLEDMGCDSYSASAHKWFMGPKEAGVLFIKARNIPKVWPNIVAPGWGNDAEPDMQGARKFESLGQRDDACLAAVGTTVDFHNAINSSRIEERVLELSAALKTGLSDAGLPLVTPQATELSGGVCIIELSQAKRNNIKNQLYEKYGIAGATAGGLRLCPHVYNTMEHVERAIEGCRALLA